MDRPATPTAGDAPPADLRSSAVDGVKWNFVASTVAMVVRLLFTFALARLIGPESFGIVSMATLYVTFAVIVLDQGFGLALIQRRTLGPYDVASVTWLNVSLGVVLTVLTIVLAPVAADFFDTPELTGVLRALSVTLLIRGFTLVPQALVQRNLRFKEFSLITTSGVLLGGVAGVVAAALGAEHWALVVQTLVNDVLVVVWLLALFPPRQWRASWSSLRSMVGFSSKMLVTNLMYYVGQNGDNILIGRVLSSVELALYALSYRLLRMPVQMIGSVVSQVSLPVLSRLQDDDERAGSYLRVATQGVTLITFPVFAILFVASDAAVDVLFGPEWAGAQPVLAAMALAGFPMAARMVLGPAATSRGRAGLIMGWSIASVVLQLAGFAVGLWAGGMIGVAVSLVVVQGLTFLPNAWHVLSRSVHMRLGRFLSALVPPLVAAALAAGSWWLLYLPFRPEPGDAHHVVPFIAVTLLATLVHVAAVRLLWPATFRTVKDIGTQMIRKKVGG